MCKDFTLLRRLLGIIAILGFLDEFICDLKISVFWVNLEIPTSDIASQCIEFSRLLHDSDVAKIRSGEIIDAFIAE